MLHFCSSRLILALFALTFFLTTGPYLRADTYVLAVATDSNSNQPYGMDDEGDFVVTYLGCSTLPFPCYELWVAGKDVSYTSAIPSLNYDNGTKCGAGYSGTTEICNNGRVAVLLDIASAVRPSVYSGTPSILTDVAGSGGFYNPMMDSMGDILYDDGDYIREYIDLTSRLQVTPEPSSIALLSAGLLGMAGMLRRRVRSSVR
jgi:hypothetical protein